MKKIRVMIVEDSPAVCALLGYIIGLDPRLEVCPPAGSAEDALQILERLTPYVIAMGIRLPGMDGLEATRHIMLRNPIPTWVVAACIESGRGNSVAMEALRAGALTILEKPAGTTNADYRPLAERLCTQLAIMSQVRPVRRHGSRQSRFLQDTPEPGSADSGKFKMLGIVCSRGGPATLIQLLGGLGPSLPVPLLLVQHMTANFSEAFAAWLHAISPFAVTVVKDGCTPVAGGLYMAPAEHPLRVEGGQLWLDEREPVSFQRPSGTVRFESMARDLGEGALGILFTGMGEDGAAGLLDIRRCAGYTIAEDESTAVVYGMPAAAVRLGAVCESLPLPAIAPRVLELVSCQNL